MGKAKGLQKLIKKGITAAQKIRTKENKRLAKTDPEKLYDKQTKGLYESLDRKVMRVKNELRDTYGDDHIAIIDSPEYKKKLNAILTDKEKKLLKERRSESYNSGEFELFLPFKKEGYIAKKESTEASLRKKKPKDNVYDDMSDEEMFPDIPFSKGGFLTGDTSSKVRITPSDYYMKKK